MYVTSTSLEDEILWWIGQLLYFSYALVYTSANTVVCLLHLQMLSGRFSDWLCLNSRRSLSIIIYWTAQCGCIVLNIPIYKTYPRLITSVRLRVRPPSSDQLYILLRRDSGQPKPPLQKYNNMLQGCAELSIVISLLKVFFIG